MVEFSIIMNCYNCEKYLKQAIESALFQSYTNFEIIFWDNQSNDKSAKIVKSYKDERIHYNLAENFTPLGEARNLAIDKAKGKWIAFLDCDDIWDKHKLSIVSKELQQSPYKDISLIYSKSHIINTKDEVTSNHDYLISGNIYTELLKKENFIVFSSIIIKKEILISSGKINATLQYCPDYELLLKITKEHNTIGINEYLTFYRVHDTNITSTKLFENNVEVIQMLKHFQKTNTINFFLKAHIFFNNSYRTGTTVIKLFLKNELQNSFIFLKNYFVLFLFFPIALVINLIKRKKYDS